MKTLLQRNSCPLLIFLPSKHREKGLALCVVGDALCPHTVVHRVRPARGVSGSILIANRIFLH